MSFINVFVHSPSRIGIKSNRLVVENENGEEAFPLSDINSVLIEDNRSIITAYALGKLADSNAAVYFCDEKHLPSSVVLPFHSYCRPLAMLEFQLDIAKPLKKQLWQSIVKCKIEGQARALRLMGMQGYEQLEALAKTVASDDSGNVEATAAAHYFKVLLDGAGRRNTECFFNTAINYGYSIVRGLVARSLSVCGFETCLGLHHCNTLNAFNLADDLMEAFRPIVDLWVYTYVSGDELTADVKRQIFSVINAEVIVDGNKNTLSNAVQLLVESLKRSIAQKSNALSLPCFEDAVVHTYV